MDITEFAQASFVIIGLVNIVNMAMEKNWASFAKAMIAVIAATLFGYFHLLGLNGIEIGLAVGIGSSGAYKTISRLGGM